MSLDRYNFQDLTEILGKKTVNLLRSLYEIDPDTGVHSAAGWLLTTRFGDGSYLKEADQRLALAGLVEGRSWYQTPEGHTMALIVGPKSYTMGTPDWDPHVSRFSPPVDVTIPCSFAIATKEVTVEQFLRFNPGYPYSIRVSRNPTCPINSLWVDDAIRYCCWLDRQEGISEEESCYIDQLGKIERKPNYLERHGYRLPTEEEWEYANRAGSITSNFCGQSLSLMGDYGWLAENALDQSHPVALKRPNTFGLFDTMGNLTEWTSCSTKRSVAVASTRGGSFISPTVQVHSGLRSAFNGPSLNGPRIGFRIVRTLE